MRQRSSEATQQPPTQVDPPDDESLRFGLQGEGHDSNASRMTTLGMAKRLPALVLEIMRLAWQVDRTASAGLLACQVLSAVLGAAGLLATNQTIVALISSGHIASKLWHAAPAVAVIAAAAGLRSLLGIAITALSAKLSPMLTRRAQVLLLDAATDTELAAYDLPGYNDRWDLADGGTQRVAELIGECQNLIAAAASLVSAEIVLAVVHPLLLPLTLAAAVPQAVAAIRAARVSYEAVIATSPKRRVMAFLRWFMVDKWQADQVRTDGVAPFLLAKYLEHGDQVDVAEHAAVRRAARISVIGAAAAGLASCTVWVALALLLSAGQIGIGSAGAAVFALRAASTSLQGLVGYGAQLYRNGLYLDHWSNFVREASGMRLNRGCVKPQRPMVVAARQVSFSYLATDREILHQVDLEIRRGEIVALIGQNGSGKSTLMRLLSGLYLPTGGAVEWDGHDTRDLDPRAMWEHVAVVPQDYARWPLTVRENIHLGRIPADGDDAVLRAARASGADDVITSLRNGLGTLLAKEFFGGVALSTGQWQRLAVARGLLRQGGLLILDEPTSALDPQAEHRIFMGLRDVAANCATILVTHNLFNASVADRLVVMDGGRIVQQGTFAELSAMPGVFRRLLDLQSDRPVPRPRTAAAAPSPAPDHQDGSGPSED